MARKLRTELVEKPWGRTELPPQFGSTGGRRIGEVWFAGDPDLPLLAKYIFTSERLSIQVHPDDDQARRRGLPSGKSECLLILEAEPGAALGLGLTREVGEQELRDAALDGSIEALIDWRPVASGDFVMVPAGTVHAIGAGIALLEFQQNADVTYRLYDYGRPRALHLDDGIAVSRRAPFGGVVSRVDPGGDAVLVEGPHFAFVHALAPALDGRRRWVLPLEGRASCGDASAVAGECLLLDPDDPLAIDGRALVGAEQVER